MNDTTMMKAAAGDPAAVKRDLDFLDLLLILSKHKKLIILLPILTALLVGLATLALPDVYKAKVTILPPQQAQSGAAALISQLGGMAGVAAGAAGIKNPNDLYLGMLKSRTVADRMIKRFNLLQRYDITSLEKARKKLEARTVIVANKEGMITIEVEDEDRKTVALLANAYAAELMEMTKTLAVTEASQRRMFFERQLEMTKDRLADAEVALKSGMAKTGVVSVDAESRSIVETIGRLRAQVSAKEIQLNASQAFLTPNNQEYKRAQQELTSMRAQLSRLENGSPAVAGQDNGANNAGGLENIKLLRDVKYHQMLYELLAKQYEASRLDEAKDSSIIQVLDSATDPERSVKPNRVLIAIAAAVFALFVALAWSVMVEIKAMVLARPEYSERWRQLSSSLHIRRTA